MVCIYREKTQKAKAQLASVISDNKKGFLIVLIASGGLEETLDRYLLKMVIWLTGMKEKRFKILLADSSAHPLIVVFRTGYQSVSNLCPLFKRLPRVNAAKPENTFSMLLLNIFSEYMIGKVVFKW